MSQSTEKSLGQIAHESRGMLFAGPMAWAEPIPWDELPKWQQDQAEDMAQAVAAVVREQCAQACELIASLNQTREPDQWLIGIVAGADKCADAIRSMK